jgi:hypothetical protein
MILYYLYSLLLITANTAALDNGVALTPPMGFNSYMSSALQNEQGLRKAAEFIANSGMRDLGYKYINTDEGWEESSRDSQGNLQWNSTLYPSGLPTFIAFLHKNMSLLFGIYGAASGVSCGEKPGQLYFEKHDAAQYASWGVDFVKSDIELENFEIQGMSVSLFVLEPLGLCQCSPTSVQINRPFQILHSFRFFWFFVKIQPRKPLICKSLKIPTFALSASRKRCLEHAVNFVQRCFLDAQTFHGCQKFVRTRKHLSSGCRPILHLAMSSSAFPSMLPDPVRPIQVVVTGCSKGVHETRYKHP